MSILENIFSVTNEDNAKVLRILGVDFKFKNRTLAKLREEISGSEYRLKEHIKALQAYILAENIHPQVFTKYKNCNAGQTVVLCGTAPSFSKYKPIPGAKHLSLNRAFMSDNVKFDYAFAADWKAISMVSQELKEYKGNNCIKFLSNNNMKGNVIPETYLSTFEHERFVVDTCSSDDYVNFQINQNLAIQPLSLNCTIAMAAMQFLLWTNPSKLYIVGCDCSNSTAGHFDKIDTENYKRAVSTNVYDYVFREWQYLKKFATSYYPDVEIISVNPVGLKGMFKDVYTDGEGNIHSN